MQKVYTKKGDKGKTSLLGGTRVSKADIKVESYGNVDELNSHIGFLRDMMSDIFIDKMPSDLFDQFNSQHDELLVIQRKLFSIGSWLALDNVEIAQEYKMKEIREEDICRLENEMDKMAKMLSPLKNFILPGGNKLASYSHVVRTVCRRSERGVVALYESLELLEDGSVKTEILETEPNPLKNPFEYHQKIIKYLNRLSDYFFVLSRFFCKVTNSQEVLWN